MLPTDQSAGQSLATISREEENGLAHSTGSKDDFLVHIRRILGKASDDQQSLADAREKLLVHRERWKKSGLQVHEQRVETGDAEASFMSSLRAFYHENRRDLPPTLDTAYRKVTEARDKLGLMEEDFLRAEQHLTHSEWVFTEKESDFYQFDIQDIINESTHDSKEASSGIRTHTVPEFLISIEAIDAEYRAALDELDTLKEFFDSVRREQGALLSDDLTAQIKCQHEMPHIRKICDADYEENEVVDKIAMSEVKAQKLKVISMQCEKLALVRRNSEPAVENEKTSTPIRRANTENQVQILAQQIDSEQYIGEWLSEAVRNNCLGVNVDYDHVGSGQIASVHIGSHLSRSQATESIEGEKRLLEHISKTSETSQKADQDTSSSQLPRTERGVSIEAVTNTPLPLDDEALLGLSSDLFPSPTSHFKDESGNTNIPLLQLELVDPPEGNKLDPSVRSDASGGCEEGLTVGTGARIQQSAELTLLFTDDVAVAPAVQNTDLLGPPLSPRYDSGHCSEASEQGNDDIVAPSLSAAQDLPTPDENTGNLSTAKSKRAIKQSVAMTDSSTLSGSSGAKQHDEPQRRGEHTKMPLDRIGADETTIASTTHKEDSVPKNIPFQGPLLPTNNAQVATASTHRRPLVTASRHQRPRPVSDHAAVYRYVLPEVSYGSLRPEIQRRRSRSSSDASSLCRSERTIDTQIAVSLWSAICTKPCLTIYSTILLNHRMAHIHTRRRSAYRTHQGATPKSSILST